MGSILRHSAPRAVFDGGAPFAAFYLGWKLHGLTLGIALATALSLALYGYARREGRPGILARVSLGLVLIRATVGLVSGSTTVYLGQGPIVEAAEGVLCLGSLALGRPLIGLLARDIYPFPAAVRQSVTYRRVFARVTAAWGAYFLVRSTVRLVVLLTGSVERYLLVGAITGAPIVLALLSWSIRYTVRAFRRSEEWGPAISSLESLPSPGGSAPTAP